MAASCAHVPLHLLVSRPLQRLLKDVRTPGPVVRLLALPVAALVLVDQLPTVVVVRNLHNTQQLTSCHNI